MPATIETPDKHYEIKRVLGEGGTSVVYLANDGTRDVALKILGEEVDPQFVSQYVEALKNEFNLLSALRHPNVSAVFDFGFSEALEKYFLTSEYVDGADIFQVTEKADYVAIETLFVQLLSALDYIHKNGIIHCDIKCGNILVTKARDVDVVKLVDFGFSTRHLAKSDNIIGTIRYMAPELMMQLKDVDHRVDIYAAGVVLYRLLHRDFPFSQTTFEGVLDWHRKEGTVSSNPQLPAYTQELIRRLMATRPSDRFSTCANAIEFINLHTDGRYKNVLSQMNRVMPSEGPLVGRQEVVGEISQLVETLRDKTTPRFPLFVIEGSQGMGKTRLMKECRYRAQLSEVVVRQFSCQPSRDSVSEWCESFREAGKLALPSAGSDGRINQHDYRVELARWSGQLVDVLAKRPTLIMIDDLHLADPLFVDMVSTLIERLTLRFRDSSPIAVAIVISIRSMSDVSPAFSHWLQSAPHHVWALNALLQDDVVRYANDVGVADGDVQAPAIMTFSGGVPQLVEAYCQHLLSGAPSSRPPNTLADTYAQRLEQLSDEKRALISVLATSRRPLDTAVLSQLLHRPDTAIHVDLQALQDSGLVRYYHATRQAELINVALSDVVIGWLPADEKKQMAKTLAAWIESSDPSAHAELAYYYDMADEASLVVKEAVEAAHYFEGVYNNAQALHYYQLALSRESDKNERDRLNRELAHLDIYLGHYDAAIAILEELIRCKRMIVDDYRFLGMAYTKKREFEKAIHCYESGLARVAETNVPEVIRFKNSLGNVYFYKGDLESSEKYFTDAIADATEGLLLNNNLGLILSAKGNYHDAVEFYEGRRRFLEAKQNKRALAICHAECGYVHMVHNHYQEAIASFETSYALSQEMNDWHNILVVLGNLIRVHQQLAHYTLALEYAEQSLALQEKVGTIEQVAQNHLNIGILYEILGVYKVAKRNILKAERLFKDSGNTTMVGWANIALSYVYKDEDNYSQARKTLDVVIDHSSAEESSELKDWLWLSVADLCAEYRRFDEVKTALANIDEDRSDEFRIRRAMIEAKMNVYGDKKIDEAWIAHVREHIAECEAKGFRELIWEWREVLSDGLELMKQIPQSVIEIRHASDLIMEMSGQLSESYRDSYIRQRFRWRVLVRINPDLERTKPAKEMSTSSELTIDETRVTKAEDVTSSIPIKRS